MQCNDNSVAKQQSISQTSGNNGIVWFIVFVSELQDVQSVSSKRWVARPGLSCERKRLTPAEKQHSSSSSREAVKKQQRSSREAVAGREKN